MECVRCDYGESGIAKFPTKLVPDCGNCHGFSWLGRVLDRVNESCRCEKEQNNDQYRNDGPCDFNLCASIHLGRLALCVRRSAAELHDDVSQQTEDYDKNQPGDAEDEQREMTDRIRRRGARIGNACNGVVLRSRSAQPRGEEHAREEKGNARRSADDRRPIRLLHSLDDPHQASPLRLQVNQRSVTPIAVEDPNCLPTRTMQCSLHAIVSERESTNSFDLESYEARNQTNDSTV